MYTGEEKDRNGIQVCNKTCKQIGGPKCLSQSNGGGNESLP